MSNLHELLDIDGDELSLVKAAANKRRFAFLKGDNDVDRSLEDMLSVAHPNEGVLMDELRKEGADESTVNAVVIAARLLKANEDEFSEEMVEKLGRQLYPTSNPPLNSQQEKSGSYTDDGQDDDDVEMAAPPNSNDDDDDWDDDDDDMEKRDFSAGQRRSMASQGKALPDGSYPIDNKDDLDNAIKAYGRAKNKGRAKAWIMRRAKALGATDMLPDSWGKGVSKEDAEVTIDKEAGMPEATQVPVRKEDGTWDLTGVPDEARPFYESIQKEQDELREEVQKAKKIAKAEREARRTAEFIAKADTMKHLGGTDELSAILKEASENMTPESYEKLETVLKSAEEKIAEGDLFVTFGKDGTPVESQGDSYAQLEKMANELVQKGDGMTFEKAFDEVLKTPEGRALYRKYEPVAVPSGMTGEGA